ncbi:hypothetical protein DFH28DRAFT_891364 [Melampsora americana]|nr:hypothetical protein DFH28DRAFT_891364 [Melampsora americana]
MLSLSILRLESFLDTYAKKDRSSLNVDAPPADLCNRWPHLNWESVLHVVLDNNQKVVKGTFLLINFELDYHSRLKVGRVDCMWQQVESDKVFLAVKKCCLGGLIPLCGMREITETDLKVWIHTKVIETWEVSITAGLSAWFEKCPPKGVGQDAIDDNPIAEGEYLLQLDGSLSVD